MVQFKVQSTYNSFSYPVQAYVLNCLTSTLPSQQIQFQDWQELLQLQMADPGYGTPSNIDLLLGANVYGQVLSEGILRNPPGALTAQIHSWDGSCRDEFKLVGILLTLLAHIPMTTQSMICCVSSGRLKLTSIIHFYPRKKNPVKDTLNPLQLGTVWVVML